MLMSMATGGSEPTATPQFPIAAFVSSVTNHSIPVPESAPAEFSPPELGEIGSVSTNPSAAGEFRNPTRSANKR